MWLEVERRRLTCAEKVRDVFHLHEWHARRLVLDARRWNGEVDESVTILLATNGPSRH